MAILKSSTGQIILLGGGAMGALVAVALSTGGSGLCAQGSAYADGCSGAPVANANTFQNSAFFSGYAVRPPWNVAGVDYPVGISAGTTFTDWQTLSLSGVSVNTSTNIITIGNDGVTLNGIDFSLHGGVAQIYINANNVTVTNSKFGGPNQVATGSGVVYQVNGKTGFVFTNNYVDGGGNITTSNGAPQQFFLAGAGIYIVKYNYFVNYTSELVQVQNGTTNLTYEFNYIDAGYMCSGCHENWMQWSANDTVTANVEFNTGIQTAAKTLQYANGGLIWQFAEGNSSCCTAVAVNPVFSYNTMVASGPSTGPANSTVAVSRFIDGESGFAATTLSGSGQAENNYFDYTDAYNVFYPGSMTGWTVSGNINLVTGGAVTSGD